MTISRRVATTTNNTPRCNDSSSICCYYCLLYWSNPTLTCSQRPGHCACRCSRCPCRTTATTTGGGGVAGGGCVGVGVSGGMLLLCFALGCMMPTMWNMFAVGVVPLSSSVAATRSRTHGVDPADPAAISAAGSYQEQQQKIRHTMQPSGESTKQTPDYTTGDEGGRGGGDGSQSVCSALLSQHGHAAASAASSSFSPLHYWHRLVPRLIRASQLVPDDPEFHMERRIAELLQVITPRLRHAVKTLPQQSPARTYALMTKIYRRWQYVKQQKQKPMQQSLVERDININNKQSNNHANNQSSVMEEQSPLQPPPPPVFKIVVFGGSVICGRHCTSSDIPTANAIYGNLGSKECAWPRRLQVLLNNLLLMGHDGEQSDGDFLDVVQIYNACQTGTDTYIAEQLFRLDFLPLEFRHPDIVINAHSTNDAFIFFDEVGGHAERPHEFLYQDRLQSFVRTIMMMRQQHSDRPNRNDEPCWDDDEFPSRPLLLFVDDYLGNGNGHHPVVIDTMINKQNLELLSSYYGFGLISTADAVRPFTLVDTREEWFSPAGWYSSSEQQQQQQQQKTRLGDADHDRNLDSVMRKQLHPGELMHQGTAFFLTYYALEVATYTCALEQWPGVVTTNNNNNFVGDDNDEKHTPKSSLSSPSFSQLVRYQSGVPGFPDSLDGLRGLDVPYKRPRYPPEDALPPRLNSALKLDRVSQLWQNEEERLLRLQEQLSEFSRQGNSSTIQNKDNATTTVDDAGAAAGPESAQRGGGGVNSGVAVVSSSYRTCRRNSAPTHEAVVKCPFPFLAQSIEDMNVLAEHIAWGLPPWQGLVMPLKMAHQTAEQPWIYAGDGMKWGWVPNKACHEDRQKDIENSLIANFDFSSDSSSDSVITNVHVFYLKSYGEKWMGSAVKVTVLGPPQKQTPPRRNSTTEATIDNVDVEAWSSIMPAARTTWTSWPIVGESQISGYHDSSSSVVHLEVIPLTEPVRTLQIQVSLVSGTTFKLMGLTLCNDNIITAL